MIFLGAPYKVRRYLSTSYHGCHMSIGIFKAVGSLLTKDNVKSAVSLGKKAYDTIDDARAVGGAITQLSSQTTIISRAFIEESILEEQVLPNLMKSIHEWYAAQIMAALQLTRFVDDKQTVQNVMSVVQSGQNDYKRAMIDTIYDRFQSSKSFTMAYLGEEAFEELGFEAMGPFTHGGALKEIATLQGDKEALKKELDEANKNKTKPQNMNLKSVNASDHRIGPMGELFEVTLSNPNDKDSSIKVPLFIQMQPSLIPSNLAPRFIDMNVAPSIWQRWTQWRAGEISFWKDFVAGLDMVQRKKTFLKDPEAAAAFDQFLRTIQKKDVYALKDLGTKTTNTRSSNLANSVVMLTEEALEQARVDSAIDLHNTNHRAAYFRDTYTMCLVVVNRIHQRVTVYFNGLDGLLDCSYSDFKPRDSKFDPKDFVTAMQAFSTNSIGRMR